MGIFRLIKETRQATALENYVREQVGKMKDPSAITEENLLLQIYVLEKDRNRYLSGKSITAKMRNKEAGGTIDWKLVAKGFDGVIDIYKWVLDGDIEDLTARGKPLADKMAEVEKSYKKTTDIALKSYYYYQLIALWGLWFGELYFSWTNRDIPVFPNLQYGWASQYIQAQLPEPPVKQ